MGCYRKKKAPRMVVPTTSQIVSGALAPTQQSFSDAIGMAQKNFPNAYGARETGLEELANLEVGPEFFNRYALTPKSGRLTQDYFNQWLPTSFEEALASQQYKNIMSDVERGIKQNLALSGMSYSPVLADLISKRQGELGVDIGTALSDAGMQRAQLAINRDDQLNQIAQRRAELALQGRTQKALTDVSIDPTSIYAPYLDQFNNMVNLSGGQLNQQAAVDFQNALAKYNNKSAGLGMLGNVLGGVGGFMIGGPAGAAIGSGLGGAASSLWGGSGGAVDLGTAFSLASALPRRNTASTSQWVNGVGPR